LATANWSGYVQLWRMAAVGPPTNSFMCPQGFRVQGLASSADGRRMVTGSHSWYASVWDLTASYPCHPVVFRVGPIVRDVAISRDGRWMATASWEPMFQAQLWDLSTAKTPTRSAFLQFKARVFRVAFSTDQHWMAAGAWDNMVKVLDMRDLTKAPLIFAGHTGRVLDVAFSPDGQWLASQGEDHTIRLWDLTHPTALAVILGENESPALEQSMAFTSNGLSPDGRWIASGSTDGTVRLWQTSLNDLIVSACRSAGRNLTSAEWHDLFGKAPYQKTCPNPPDDQQIGHKPLGSM
jgi:WD40 repeat protein